MARMDTRRDTRMDSRMDRWLQGLADRAIAVLFRVSRVRLLTSSGPHSPLVTRLRSLASGRWRVTPTVAEVRQQT